MKGETIEHSEVLITRYVARAVQGGRLRAIVVVNALPCRNCLRVMAAICNAGVFVMGRAAGRDLAESDRSAPEGMAVDAGAPPTPYRLSRYVRGF